MSNTSHPSDRYSCDRCGTAVALSEAKITGALTEPTEVICMGCLTPDDRLITDSEAR